jgi:uncharacterized protein involved in copper resistance
MSLHATAVVDHNVANKKCREMMGAAYAMNKEQTNQSEIHSMDHCAQGVESDALPSSSQSRKIGSIDAKNILPASSSKSKKSKNTSDLVVDRKRQRRITDY